jgi:hypothetical protein
MHSSIINLEGNQIERKDGEFEGWQPEQSDDLTVICSSK